MTAQISDSVFFEHRQFCIAGISGTGLFDPADHGLRPGPLTSACWRGFHCEYRVQDAALYLCEVHLGLIRTDAESIDQGEGPSLFGRVARVRYRKRRATKQGESRPDQPECSVVTGLKELIPFTGGLLLGAEFIEEMYVHMGFHPAYKYRIVHELVFDAGRLIESHGRTREIAEFRSMLSARSLQPGYDATRAEISEWIDRSFSREYTGFAASGLRRRRRDRTNRPTDS